MVAEPLRAARVAQARPSAWGGATGAEEVRAYVQDRLELFSKITTLSSGILLLFVFGMYEVYPDARPARADLVHSFALAGVATLLVIWGFVLRRNQLPLRWLYAIDAFYMFVLGTAFGISAYFSPDQRAAVYAAFIWETITIFSRVLVVPSSARRTAIVTTVSYLPLMTASVFSALYQETFLELPPVAFVGGTWWFAVWSATLATWGSQIIYGLRQKVSDAMQLGQYTLVEPIGKGGMGEVYRARHRLLRRPTAIKLLPPAKVGAETIKRFEREVQHMSHLTHPNTVAIYDYGHTPDGFFYYAMEYLDGVDLDVLVELDGPQPAPRVIHILRQVCGALDEAHARGLIHRDIKPSNVILCQRGRAPDVAKVFDFGLVKEITRDANQSVTRVIAGTPAYISPEAVTDPDRVGPQSDLYSVGAVGYFLLTGTRPFTGKTAIDVCIQHVSAAPVPPSERLGKPVDAALEALILACLEKDPAKRPETAQALRAALTRLTAYDAWDETAAMQWWIDFEARRAKGKTPSAAGATPGTVTIDIAARALDLGLEDTASVEKL